MNVPAFDGSGAQDDPEATRTRHVQAVEERE